MFFNRNAQKLAKNLKSLLSSTKKDDVTTNCLLRQTPRKLIKMLNNSLELVTELSSLAWISWPKANHCTIFFRGTCKERPLCFTSLHPPWPRNGCDFNPCQRMHRISFSTHTIKICLVSLLTLPSLLFSFKFVLFSLSDLRTAFVFPS